MPKDDVATCVQVFPAPPINREFWVTVLRPVPPRVPASVPIQVGVKV